MHKQQHQRIELLLLDTLGNELSDLNGAGLLKMRIIADSGGVLLEFIKKPP